MNSFWQQGGSSISELMNSFWQQGGSSADGAASSDEEDEDIDAEDDFHYEMEEEPTYVLSICVNKESEASVPLASFICKHKTKVVEVFYFSCRLVWNPLSEHTGATYVCDMGISGVQKSGSMHHSHWGYIRSNTITNTIVWLTFRHWRYYYFCSCRESKSKEEYDGIDTDNLITLERLKQNQRQDYLKVGSPLCYPNNSGS